jgi:hypothetical protein
LFVPFQGLLAAGGVFGQVDVSIGAVGADAQGVYGQLNSLLLVGFLESPLQERLGLAERHVLVLLALQLAGKLLHYSGKTIYHPRSPRSTFASDVFIAGLSLLPLALWLVLASLLGLGNIEVILVSFIFKRSAPCHSRATPPGSQGSTALRWVDV